jgi:hypothetical protein
MAGMVVRVLDLTFIGSIKLTDKFSVQLQLEVWAKVHLEPVAGCSYFRLLRSSRHRIQNLGADTHSPSLFPKILENELSDFADHEPSPYGRADAALCNRIYMDIQSEVT